MSDCGVVLSTTYSVGSSGFQRWNSGSRWWGGGPWGLTSAVCSDPRQGIMCPIRAHGTPYGAFEKRRWKRLRVSEQITDNNDMIMDYLSIYGVLRTGVLSKAGIPMRISDQV